MVARHLLAVALVLLNSAAAADDTKNTSASIIITDATGVPQTATSVSAASTTSASKVPNQTTITNPVAATAPGATITTTSGSESITVSALTANTVLPSMVAAVAAQDLFAQIANDNPATVLSGTVQHPVSPSSVAAPYIGSTGLPVATNNYYGNLFLGDQSSAAYVMPYTVFWKKGTGLCAWSTDDSDYVFGSYNAGVESTPGPHYYYNAAGMCPIGFSSTEMSSTQTMTASNIDHQSVRLTFAPGSGSGTMQIPLVQGNAFLTSIYSGLTPEIFSNSAFTGLIPVTYKTSSTAGSVGSKYRVTINNGDTWLVYVFPSTTGSSSSLTLASNVITGPVAFSGVIQIAKLPENYATSDESVYDAGAGTYATQNIISGTSTGAVGTYNFDFGAKALAGNSLLSFLFPHQIASVSSGVATTLKLWSNTKGLMQAYIGNTLSFTESDMPINVQFLPWSPTGQVTNYSADALQAIAKAANAEASQVIASQANTGSFYTGGKILAKFAQICLTIHDVLGQDASSCVAGLEQSIGLYISNSNTYPLVYDSVWKGAISSCGDSGCDYGNAWYNDHHFHYGYFVYTAAVIGHLDPSWLTTKNKAYINTMLRDFANPSTSDTAFPQFRSFDWYAGHSWAHGITASTDGKDEESSSEDYNAIYGMKLWGNVIGDASMEGRGNLMLAVMRRSMQSYMLMASDNIVQPAAFVPQFVAGITFMNKVDHTTYFGNAEQYIQGIHMIPLTPISAYIRTPTFVGEEWSAVIKPILSGVTDGWLGILMANYAIYNATASFEFFNSTSFTSSYLDNGASLTWYLTYAAGLGGDPAAVVRSISSSSTSVQSSTLFSSQMSSTKLIPSSTSTTSSTKVVSSSSLSSTATNHATTSSISVTSTVSTSSSLSSSHDISVTTSTTSTGAASSTSKNPLTSTAAITTSASASIPVSLTRTSSSLSMTTSKSVLNGATVTGTAINVPNSDTSSLKSGTIVEFSASSTQTIATQTMESTRMTEQTTSLASTTSTEPTRAHTTDDSVSSSSVIIGSTDTVTSSASATTSGAMASTVVTVSIGSGLSVSCSGTSLLVGPNSDPLTIYSNGTLACGTQNAVILPVLSSQSEFSINLATVLSSQGLNTRFVLQDQTLLLYLTSQKKRQASSTAGQSLVFGYNEANVLYAMLPGSNSSLTTVTPTVKSVSMSSDQSSTTLVAPTTTSVSTATSEILVTSFTPVASLDGSAGVAGVPASQLTSTITSTTAQMTTSAATSIGRSSADSSNTASPNAPTPKGGNAIAADQAVATGSNTSPAQTPSTASSTTVTYTTTVGGISSTITTVVAVEASPTSYSTSTYTTLVDGQTVTVTSVDPIMPASTSYSTLTYTTTVNGQSTIVTTAIPIQTIVRVATTTINACDACPTVTGTSISAGGSGAEAQNTAAPGTTLVSTVVQGRNTVTTTTTIGSATAGPVTSGNAQVVAAGNVAGQAEQASLGASTATTAVADQASAANVVVSSLPSNAISQVAAATAASTSVSSSNNNLPIVSANSLPTSTSSAGKLFLSFTSIVAMLLYHLA